MTKETLSEIKELTKKHTIEKISHHLDFLKSELNEEDYNFLQELVKKESLAPPNTALFFKPQNVETAEKLKKEGYLSYRHPDSAFDKGGYELTSKTKKLFN